jgi:hypothetical protein
MVSPKTPKTLRSQACLLFCFARRFPGSLDQEPIKRSSAGITIQRVSRLLELDALKQPLDITGDSICGHDAGGVERVDILAGDRTFGVANQRRDGHLGEAEVVGDAREAVGVRAASHREAQSP